MKEPLQDKELKFANQLKASWRQKAAIDLKGKLLSSINLEVEDGLVLEPIYTAEELDSTLPIVWRPDQKGWKIVGRFILLKENGISEVNHQILQSLQGGCEVIEIDVRDYGHFDMSKLFDGVLLEMVCTRLHVHSNQVSAVKKYLADYCLDNSIEKKIQLDCFDDSIHFIELDINDELHSLSLANLLSRIESFFVEKGTISWSQLLIHWSVGSHMLVEVSKIRALKLLIYALAEKINKPLVDFPVLQARATSTVIDEELEVFIERGTKAFSAVIGGADELYIDYQFETKMNLAEDDKKRVIRNIHWLLKLESQLEFMDDLARGAYWIEMCTKQIFERAWAKYNKGGEG
jgi:hypothetical protein